MGRRVGDRKAEEEPIAELLATTTTPRGPARLPIPPFMAAAQQARDLRDTPWGGAAGQRPGAERRKLAASGAAEVRGDPLNSRTAKAMSPRYPTNQVAHFWCLPDDSSVVPTCP